MRTVLMIIISTIIMSARTVLMMARRHDDLLVWRQIIEENGQPEKVGYSHQLR